MTSVGDVLRSLADPFAPLLRERIERAMPPGTTLADVTIEGTDVRLFGLVLRLGAATVTADSLRIRLVPRALFPLGGNAAKLTLVEASGEATLDVPGVSGAPTRVRASLRFERLANGSGDAWAFGALVATCGALKLRATLDLRDEGLSVRDLRLRGPRGTGIEGSLAAIDDRLTGKLEGPVHLADLPPEARLSSENLPFDLGDLAVRVAIVLSGRRDAPEARFTFTARDLPLRPKGQKRFLPHLRMESVSATARVSVHETSGEGQIVLAGGGTINLVAAWIGATRTFDATLAAISAGVVRHGLALAGAGGFLWESGTIDGKIRVAEGASPTDSLARALHIHADLGSAEPVLTLGAASFPLTGASAIVSGAIASPSVRVAATLDGGELLFTREASPGSDFFLSLRGSGPRPLTRLALADPTMIPLVLPGDAMRDGALVLPHDLALSLTASPRPGDLTADVLLEGGGSRIHVVLGATKGAHLRSKLEGTVTLSHATTLFSLSERAPGVGLSGDPLVFDLALVGSAVAPSLIGKVGAGRLVVAHDGRSLSLESAEAHVHVTPTFVAFHDLRASIGLGFLRGAGVVLLVDGQPSARASFVSENIRIGRTELFPEGAPLDGRAFAHAEVRHGPTGTRGELRVRVEGPTYGFLPKATAGLAKLGLPQVPTSGDAALEAHAHFSPGLVRVADLRASVPGLRAHASGESREHGEILVADVRVTVERAWLSRSAMFALPGLVLGSVEVPVSVRGSVARPETRSALAKAIFTSLSRGLFSRKTVGTLKALGPASIFIPKSPYADGSDDATHLQVLVGGTLPQVDLAALARRFVHDGTTTS